MEPVADCQAGCDDKKGIGESRIARRGDFVQRMIDDEHCHHDGFAAPCCHLESDAKKPRVRFLICRHESTMN